VELLRTDIPDQNVDRRVLANRWSQPGDIAAFKKIPAADETDIQTRGPTRFIMDDRVFQLQTASMEYRLETDWLKKVNIQNARISLNMSDLFYISSVKRERGLEYPFARRAGASITLTF
jgi:capsid portal protein